MFCMLKKKYIMLMFQNITQIMKNKLFFCTTCESLHELEADHRGGSRTAMTSGTELLVEIVNSFYQWTIVTKFSVSDVGTVPPEYTGLDDKAF